MPSNDNQPKKVALVHDWLAGMRGAERCLEVFCDMFPEADIFTLFHVQGSVSKKIESHRIHTSFLNAFPSVGSYYRYLLPIMPYAVESFRFDGYDLVISGSSCVAKGVIVPQGVRHVSYVYSPMRYAWDLSGIYFGGTGGWQRFRYGVVSSMLHPLRVWDTSSWARPDEIAVVSEYIGDRLKKVSRRESVVIYPPVDTEFFSKGLREKKSDYFLMVTAFEPSRQPMVAIKALTELGVPLKVVGSLGRYGRQCKSEAGKNVEFLGRVTDEELMKLYGSALGLIVPGIEDFGMAPVEALAAGTPVIVNDEGGAKEILADVVTKLGVQFNCGSVDSLRRAVVEIRKGWENKMWDREYLSRSSLRFSRDRFVAEFKKMIEGTHGTI